MVHRASMFYLQLFGKLKRYFIATRKKDTVITSGVVTYYESLPDRVILCLRRDSVVVFSWTIPAGEAVAAAGVVALPVGCSCSGAPLLQLLFDMYALLQLLTTAATVLLITVGSATWALFVLSLFEPKQLGTLLTATFAVCAAAATGAGTAGCFCSVMTDGRCGTVVQVRLAEARAGLSSDGDWVQFGTDTTVGWPVWFHCDGCGFTVDTFPALR